MTIPPNDTPVDTPAADDSTSESAPDEPSAPGSGPQRPGRNGFGKRRNHRGGRRRFGPGPRDGRGPQAPGEEGQPDASMMDGPQPGPATESAGPDNPVNSPLDTAL